MRGRAHAGPEVKSPTVAPAEIRRKPRTNMPEFGLASAPDLLFLQSKAGNAAVSELVEMQRQAAVVEAPAAPAAAPAPAPAPAPKPRTTMTGSHPALSKGSHGAAVQELQVKLNLIPSAVGDAFLTVDGKFGGGTDAAVRAFQSTVMHLAVPPGNVGPKTWAAIDSALVAAENAPRVHPVLHLNDVRAEVGEAQEKLNAAGAAAPLLAVDGVFRAGMFTAVKKFQQTTMALAVPSGVIDAPTWTALDAAAPGGGTRAARGGTNIEEHVNVPGGGRATAVAIGSMHPVIGPGNVLTGVAVKEMQQKLNAFLASKGKAYMKAKGVKTLGDDGQFGPKTQAVLNVFQAENPPVPLTGLGDAATWAKLDAFASSVGQISRRWTEVVGGHTYGMTSVYSWRMSPSAITVTVGINFQPPAPAAPMPAVPVGTWFNDMKGAWNRFKAVKTTDPTKSIDIVFNPIQSTDASARQVAVMPGVKRSDAGHWYAADPNIADTVAHEFGHMLGLRDEYQQTAADYRTVVGYETPVGQMGGPASGATPVQVAQQLQNAMVARTSPSAAVYPAGQAVAGMQQGAFAQRVIQAYQGLAQVAVPAQVRIPAAPPNPGVDASAAFTTSNDLVGDLDKGLNNIDGGTIPLNKYQVIGVLSYDSGSIMGDPRRQPDQHEHGSQARHVREFAEIVQHEKGGTWEAAPR
jgi:peptidoglycan hydrolase-like protein with peptidoglycan-binding domain